MNWTKFIFIGFFFTVLSVIPSHAQNDIFKEDSSKIEVTPLNINSNRGDFSPFLLGNKLYFSSGRVHRYGLVYIDADTSKELEDVFYAEKIDSVNFKHPHYFSEKVNTKYNDGPVCFNKSGDLMFITGNDEKRMTHQMEPLDIFVSKKTDHTWSHPASLPFCTGTSSYCHPTLLNDGKTLIFASDMPGGLGGMDLYLSKFENETWSKPQNLGAPINSKDNEIFPYVSAAGILYFSSNRQNGLGGLDFYKIDFNDPFSNELVLLPSPYNSTKDDFGIWADSTGRSGYLTSNRGTHGDDDIYYFKNKYPDFENCVTYKKPGYCYTFFEESTLAAEDSSGMTYEWDLGDGTRTRGLKVKHCFSGIGNYSIQLNIIDKSSGALFYNELSYDFTVEDPKQLYIDCPDTLPTGVTTKLDSKRSFLAGYTIKETFWFFGDDIYALGTTAQHAYKTDGIYYIHLGVLARNDSTGKLKKFCSQKTVLVKDSQWIKEHVSTVTKTVWPPTHAVDPKYHVKQGDSINFRVNLGSSKENIPTSSKIFAGIKDVQKFKDGGRYRYTSGEVKKLSDAIPYYKKAKEKGFSNAVVISFYGDSLIPKQERSMKGEIGNYKSIAIEIDPTKVLYKRTILFEFDKTNIDDSYKGLLDSLSITMKEDKKLELIILSVSDTVGTAEYNYKLSKKRAQTVQKYLKNKGIREKRLDILPFGENIPLEYEEPKNVVISNRRVELLLVKNTR